MSMTLISACVDIKETTTNIKANTRCAIFGYLPLFFVG